MDKKTKGLADNGQGEFILNESGTSVSTDHVEPPSDNEPIVPPAAEAADQSGE